MNSPSSNWAPYYNYKDCSQGICSIYCPQWCYIIFPPPPPFVRVDEDDSESTLSPLIVAVIGIFATALLLVIYCTIISRYCKRREDQIPVAELETSQDQITHEQWRAAPTGLDEAVIKSITVFRYKKGDGLVEGTECAVCLTEFQENESLRLLPKCSHAFHLPCIDTWLKSHLNCPLCRANVASSASTECSSNLNISALQVQHPDDDLILEMDVDVDADHRERGHEGEVVVGIPSDPTQKSALQGVHKMENSEQNMVEIRQENVVMQQFRRSFSLSSFSSRGHLLVADILQISEEDEDAQMGWGANSMPMRRSISTGMCSFTRHDKGKSSIIPG